MVVAVVGFVDVVVVAASIAAAMVHGAVIDVVVCAKPKTSDEVVGMRARYFSKWYRCTLVL